MGSSPATATATVAWPAYVASDSVVDRDRIAQQLRRREQAGAEAAPWAVTVAGGLPTHTASKRCDEACFLNTTAEWLSLALTSVVLQGRPAATARLGPTTTPAAPCSAVLPASSFARYAALFSLLAATLAAPQGACAACTTAQSSTWATSVGSWMCEYG